MAKPLPSPYLKEIHREVLLLNLAIFSNEDIALMVGRSPSRIAEYNTKLMDAFCEQHNRSMEMVCRKVMEHPELVNALVEEFRKKHGQWILCIGLDEYINYDWIVDGDKKELRITKHTR